MTESRNTVKNMDLPLTLKYWQYFLTLSKNKLPRSPRIPQDLPGSPRISQDLPGSPRISQDLLGSLRISQDLPWISQGSPRISQDLPGSLRIFDFNQPSFP